MSKKKKLSHAQKLQIRQARNSADQDQEIPLAAIEAYAEAFEWAQDNVDKAAELTAQTSEEIHHNAISIAYRKHFGFPDDQAESVAAAIKTWHILNGFKYFYDWWNVPIALMSTTEIIAQLDRDRQAGRVPALLDDEGNPVATKG